MSFLAKLLLGNGTLSPKVRAGLDSEGLVLIEEGLPGSIRYEHFRSPGRRFHGKVTAEVFGLGISEERFAVYCRSGRRKLADSPFSNPRLDALDVSLDDEGRVAIRMDFDRADVPNVSGLMIIRIRTPNAVQIVEQLRARLGR